MNTIIEKIRAEIERRKKELDKDKTIHPANQAGRIKELDLILSRLSDLEKEEKPVPADLELEEAANKYAEDNTWVNEFTNDGEIPEWYKHTAEMFKAVASWQKERDDKELSEKIASAYQLGLADKEKQMIKEAVEVEVTETCGISSVWIKTKQFKPGQKVKIIIVKED